MARSRDREDQRHREKLQRKIDREEPFIEFPFHPISLLASGPIIETHLAVTERHAAALLAAGQAVPPDIRCRWLLDTGADCCVVKHEIARRAGLKLINANARLEGVGVDTTGRVYVGRILFAIPSRSVDGVRHVIAVDTEVVSGDLKSDRIDGIIGRSVLAAFEIRYNGRTGKVTMRYLKG